MDGGNGRRRCNARTPSKTWTALAGGPFVFSCLVISGEIRFVQLKLRTVDLPLRHVFRTAHGATAVQENVIVELRDGDLAGFGEGASSRYYGVTAANIAADLEAARSEIESWPLAVPAELWQRALPMFAANRFALAALDAAAHDLWGKKLGRPTYRVWGLELD